MDGRLIHLGCSGLSYSGGKAGGTSSGYSGDPYNGSASSWETPFLGACWIGYDQWRIGAPRTDLSAWEDLGGPGGLIVVFGRNISGNGSYRSYGSTNIIWNGWR